MKTLVALFVVLLTVPMMAQTYTPKSVVINGPVDHAEALRIADIAAGTLTKEQIDAALGRLANTGMYADLSYTVNGSALTIVLTPSAAAESEPVVLANFVWWKPGELEPLVEARVPGYHGKLAAAGTMTQQVKDALIALLQEKGVEGVRLEARETRAAGKSTTISIASPAITVGKFALQDGLSALEKNVAGFAVTLQGEDFDVGETTKSIEDTVNDMYQNAGYLDVATSVPTYSAPQKTVSGYAVDVTASVTPGTIYSVAALQIAPEAPVTLAELSKAAGMKAGDPASPAAVRLAKGEMEKAYRDAAYLDAKATITTAKDDAAHTVSYSVRLQAGAPYHFGKLDLEALTPEQRAEFAKAFHPAPGTLADRQMRVSLRNAALEAHMGLVAFEVHPDRATHTVTVVVKPTGARP